MSTYLVSTYDGIVDEDDFGYKVYRNNITTVAHSGYCRDVYFAVNVAEGYFYLVQESGYILKRRSLETGSLQATEYAHLGNFGVFPVVVDGNGNLWTIDFADHANARRWAADLSSSTTLSIPGGASISRIFHLAFTESGDYLYLVGVNSDWGEGYVTKLKVEDWSLEWEVNEYTGDGFSPTEVITDENDDIYIFGSYGDFSGGIKKLSGIDGSVTWGADDGVGDGLGNAYKNVYLNGRLYVDAGATNRYAQLDSSDGSVINYSATVERAPMVIALFDADLLVGCGSSHETELPLDFFTFDTNEWVAGENWIQGINIGPQSSNIPFRSDATGYIHSVLAGGVGPIIYYPRVDVIDVEEKPKDGGYKSIYGDNISVRSIVPSEDLLILGDEDVAGRLHVADSDIVIKRTAKSIDSSLYIAPETLRGTADHLAHGKLTIEESKPLVDRIGNNLDLWDNTETLTIWKED